MKHSNLKMFLRVIANILIIILLVQFIGFEKINEAATKAKIEYFILVLIFFVVSTFLTTLAILPLTKTNKVWEMFKFKAISWSTGMLLPSRLGEISLIFLLKKTEIPTKKAMAIFFLDRFVSFSIICFISLIALVKYFEIKIGLDYLVIFLLVFLLMLVVKIKIKKFSNLLSRTTSYLKSEKKAIIANYFFSSVNFLLMFFVIQAVFALIGQKVNLVDVALISSLALFVGLIPITISGLGLREGVLVYMYTIIGVKPEYSILVALVFLISSYLLGAVFLGLFYNEFSFILKKKEMHV